MENLTPNERRWRIRMRGHRPPARRSPCLVARSRGAGFTLIELLVVILIIGLVSAVALPTVLSALNSRQVSEAGRILQGALVGARDRAIHDGQPSGLRLLPDPAFPLQWTTYNTIDPTQILAYNRALPIGPAPEYTEGMVSVYPTTGPNKTDYSSIMPIGWACLIVEQAVVDAQGLPNAPTSWSWNVRVGDKIQLNNAGPWYTVVGPTVVGPTPSAITPGNAELFVNYGASGVNPPWTRNSNLTEVLFLVNGRDDNGNGWVDEGWDGVDNDGNGSADVATSTISEWEPEQWLGAAASPSGLFSVPYTIQRRPSPTAGSREIALPSSMVIDATTWNNSSPERSRLPVNQYNGFVEILINPDGTVFYNLPYGTPSSIGMDQSFYHFWLAERQDVAAPVVPSQSGYPYLPLPPGVAAVASPSITAPGELKGNYSLLSLFARTGQIVVNSNPPFLYDSAAGYNDQTGTYYASNPFIPAEQGNRGGP